MMYGHSNDESIDFFLLIREKFFKYTWSYICLCLQRMTDTDIRQGD